jgi:DNA-directed RNA polymerase subunit F
MGARLGTAHRWCRRDPVAQSCDAEGMARDYIALDTRVLPGSFAVEIVPEIGHGLDEKTRAARKAVTDASHAQRVAAAQAREVARELRAAGLSGRDIAKVLDVSPQRVSQLLRTGS